VAGSSRPPAWLFDPQTSGGLLGAVRPDRVADTLERLRQRGYREAAVIGEIIAAAAKGPSSIVLR
jgi:selenide,water dikinase